jgi:hypothetical protein
VKTTQALLLIIFGSLTIYGSALPAALAQDFPEPQIPSVDNGMPRESAQENSTSDTGSSESKGPPLLPAAQPTPSKKTLQGGLSVTGIIETAPVTGNRSFSAVTEKNFTDWMGTSHPKFAMFAEKTMNQSQVMVISGWLDNSAKILRYFGIPHTSISPDMLTKPDILKYSQVVMVDCPGIIPMAGQDILRDFVSSGGSIVTTHLALGNCLEDSIPNFIESTTTDVQNVSRREVIGARIDQVSEPLVKRVVSNGYWRLPSINEPVKIVNPKAQIIVSSENYKSQYDPSGEGALAITFPYGEGYVLHVIGHLFNDSSSEHSLEDFSPEMGISMRQGIIANFVIEGLKQKRANARAQGSNKSR